MEDKKKTCIICEAYDKEVEATHEAIFNGDLIPVCKFHYDKLSKKNAKPDK